MTKVCSMCKKLKSSDFFYTGYRRGSEYLFSRCKECLKIVNASQKDNNRNWELKKNYGISLEEYIQACLDRNDKCDICGLLFNGLHVDHCHKTNKIRGYLCGSCNRGIGLLKDNINTLKSAITYLEKYENSLHS